MQVLGMLTGNLNDVLARQGSTVIIGFVGNGNRAPIVFYELLKGYHSTTGDQREQTASVTYDLRYVVDR